MSESEMQAELERLRAENAQLKSKDKGGGLSLKVSEKGGVSLYGLGRFPVTLYKEQWLRILASAAGVEGFIRANGATGGWAPGFAHIGGLSLARPWDV